MIWHNICIDNNGISDDDLITISNHLFDLAIEKQVGIPFCSIFPYFQYSLIHDLALCCPDDKNWTQRKRGT